MSLEIERKKMERKRVQLSCDEYKFKILEREEDIRKLKVQIEVQEKRLVEIDEQLNEQEK